MSVCLVQFFSDSWYVQISCIIKKKKKKKKKKPKKKKKKEEIHGDCSVWDQTWPQSQKEFGWIRESLVHFWSSPVCSKVVSPDFNSLESWPLRCVDHFERQQKCDTPILTHTLSYIARTHSMLPVQLSTTSFIHALSGCAIFNMIKKKRKEELN